MRLDLEAWLLFLQSPGVFNRPFAHFDKDNKVVMMDMATDASANKDLGAGGVCGNQWFVLQWEEDFIKKYNPSINYLELYALTVGVFSWVHMFKNHNIVIHCDNTSVCHMVNSMTSSCPNCMILIRLLVLKVLYHNVTLSVQYVKSADNLYPDLLSRMRYDRFRKISRLNGKTFDAKPNVIPEELWPMEKVCWQYNFK